jgi:hypothetical protein
MNMDHMVDAAGMVDLGDVGDLVNAAVMVDMHVRCGICSQGESGEAGK